MWRQPDSYKFVTTTRRRQTENCDYLNSVVSRDPDNAIVLEIDGLEHELYDRERDERFTVRVDQPLRIANRQLVALLGPSGCGKTTLLTVLGLLRKPTNFRSLKSFYIQVWTDCSGWHVMDLRFLYRNCSQYTFEGIRREHIGFTLQSGELLPSLTVRENIAVPLKLNSRTYSERYQRVDELMTLFGLTEEGSTKPSNRIGHSRINKLSGGEYQRVALARAMAHRPSLLFIDEPTSALNRELAWDALRQVRRLQCGPTSKGAAVMITHDEYLATAFADVIVRMRPVPRKSEGEVVEIVPNCPTEIIEPETEQEAPSASC